MIKTQEFLKIGSIYELNTDLSDENEVLCKGSPILLIKHKEKNIFIAVDYRGKQWEITQNDVHYDEIVELPKEKDIKRYNAYRVLSKFQWIIGLFLIFIGIFLIVLTSKLIYNSSVIFVVLLAIAEAIVITFGIFLICSAGSYKIPSYEKENIDELKKILETKNGYNF